MMHPNVPQRSAATPKTLPLMTLMKMMNADRFHWKKKQ